MSIGFHWFRGIEQRYSQDYHDIYYYNHYFGGGDTSHSAPNVVIVQSLFERYGGFRLPQFLSSYTDPCLFHYGNDYPLIPPEKVSETCSVILSSNDEEIGDMRERIEWFKRLSDEGYFLAYDLPN